MKTKLLITSLFMMGLGGLYAQKPLPKRIESQLNSSKKLNLTSLEQQLSSASLRKNTNLTVSIPNVNGQNENFILVERDFMSPKLREKFPNIKSYYGYSASNPSKKISLGYSNYRGINAIVYDDNDNYIIEKNKNEYSLINSKNLSNSKNFKYQDKPSTNTIKKSNKTVEEEQFNNPPVYRKYRLAVATDYSYNSYFAAEGEEPTLENSITAVNEVLTYVFPLYENDLSISFQLVDNLDKVTILTEESNPYDYSFKEDEFSPQVHEQFAEKIGNENYDIGILLTNSILGGYSLAGDEGGNVCDNTLKGATYVGHGEFPIPRGFLYAMTITHEMGHSFGATHTFDEMELGGGMTIMSYAGVFRVMNFGAYDAIPEILPQFHNSTLKEINDYLVITASCGISSPSTNNPPIADAGQDYSIPKGTAFKLTGSATDADDDYLTYTWEQDDTKFNMYTKPSKNATEGPNFSGYQNTPNPEHYFPPLDYVLNGQLYPTWNTTSDVARDFNFILQVRDNQPGGGQIASDSNIITVTDNGPFKINNISLNQSFKVGETFTLQWDVAGTNNPEINTQNVRIKLTTDNGNTFTTLVESTPNNGSATITLPADLSTEKANIIIEAIDNIYYAASPFIAIGYEISLSCKEYSKNDPIIVDEEPNDYSISITGESRPIEDISLLAKASSSNLVVYFKKIGLDESYQSVWQTTCSNSSFDYKFNRFGESPFENCNIAGATISGAPMDFSQYMSTPSNGEYIFRINKVEPVPTEEEEEEEEEKRKIREDVEITVNKIGIELCHRTASTLNTVDLTKQNELFMYPNPTNGLFNIRMTTKTNKVNVDIMNMAGQVVMTKLFNLNTNTINQSIDATNLTKGVYIVKINDGEQTQTKKLIIK